MKYAIQLYTLRDFISNEETLIQALLQLKEMGYQGVEFAGYYGISIAKIKELLAETGMQAVGSHIGIDDLEHELEKSLSDAAALGLKKVAMSWSAANSPEEIQRTLRVLKAAQEAAKTYGMELLYHNHSHELQPVEGWEGLALERIKATVPLEVDLYWVFHAGFDPVRFLRENIAEIGLVHIKDGKKAEPAPCALGEGENDIPGICAAAKDCGVEWLIVENDDPTPDGLQDAGRSMAYLKDCGN